MNQFLKAMQSPITCDVCGKLMLPCYGGGWDYDAMICEDSLYCGAEITYPTSTEYIAKSITMEPHNED